MCLSHDVLSNNTFGFKENVIFSTKTFSKILLNENKHT